jgi:hypothetical protein
MQLAQVPMVAAADQIKAAAEADPASGYTNIALDVPTHTVTVYWKGTVPATITHLIQALRSPAVIIKVQPSAHSKKELDHRMLALQKAAPHYAARGVHLRDIGAKVDGSGLDVGIDAPGATAAAFAEARSVLTEDQDTANSSSIPITVKAAPKIHPTHRLQDVPNHWAGARITGKEASYGHCTTGFPMRRRSDGRTFITTAYHCDGPAGHPEYYQWWDYWNDNFCNNNFSCTTYRMGEVWYRHSPLDVEYIRPPNGAVEGQTYTRGVAPGNQQYRPISSVGSNYSGQYVCTSGAMSGEHCDVVTQSFAYTVLWWADYQWVPIWYAYQKDGLPATAGGDSGGPVVTISGDGWHDKANGMIDLSWGDDWWWGNDLDEWCSGSDKVGFVDEQVILNWLAADLLTY